MGSTLSRRQADLLTNHFDQVVLMLDGGEAGRQGTSATSSILTGRMVVAVVTLQDGTQPDRLTAGEIQPLVRHSASIPTVEAT